MSRYTITEPHPTVVKNAYTHSGRGGAGNMFRAPETTPGSGVPTVSQAAPKSSNRFYSGRGGAGNAHAAAERVALDFDEEYATATAREKVHYGHVGRGGAGNVFMPSVKESSSSRRDSSSTSSLRSSFWGRLSSSH